MKPPIRRMLEGVLSRDPHGLNTDWDGSLLVAALLAWEEATGEARYGEFAVRWFAHHLANGHRLTDEEFYSGYTGVRSKILRQGPIPFTAYCGHWGLVYACPGISRLTGNPAAAATADAVASYILHRAARNAKGCVYHDDDASFTIPDTCYFAAPIMAIASRLTGKSVYMEHAVHQLRAFTELFVDRETGLAFTLWSAEGKPRNFWSRASGWMSGALVHTLEHMSERQPEYGEFAGALRGMAEGIVRVQREDGGFHLLLDRPDVPVDCTAPAMLAHALSRGVRLGVLEPAYGEAARRAWEAAARFVTEEGRPVRAYTGWAVSAINEQFGSDTFDAPRDFVTGLILLTAAGFEAAGPEKGELPA